MTTNTNHIRIRNITEGQLLSCDHCGQSQIVRLPIPLDEWRKIGNRFQKTHRHCRPRPSADTPEKS